MYDYRWRLEDGEDLGNGGRIVFVNGEYRADDAIGRLMADMDQSDPERAFNEEVRESLTMLAGEEGLKEMSDEMEKILDEVFREGEASGKAEGEKIGETRSKAELAARMLKDGRYTLDEIVNITGLSAEQVGEATAKYGDK